MELEAVAGRLQELSSYDVHAPQRPRGAHWQNDLSRLYSLVTMFSKGGRADWAARAHASAAGWQYQGPAPPLPDHFVSDAKEARGRRISSPPLCPGLPRLGMRTWLQIGLCPA